MISDSSDDGSRGGSSTDGSSTDGSSIDGAAERSSGADASGESAGSLADGGRVRGGHADASEDQESPVNFDEAPVAELEIDGTDYRLDAGRAGTALCISTRLTGTWDWAFRGEARWQNNVLRCKAFDRTVLAELSKALKEAAAATE